MCREKIGASNLSRSMIVVLVSSSVTVRNAHAQRPPMASSDTARTRMAPLKWLVGEWAGPATVTSGARKFSLTQRETAIEAANGTVLMI